MEYLELIRYVEHQTKQHPLIAKGVTIHTDFYGNEYKIGDLVRIKSSYGIESEGILTLICDQGICLIGEGRWQQTHSSTYKEGVWEHIEKLDAHFELNLI